MKLRKLEMALEDVEDFEEPKIKLEQYSTTSHLAASMIHTAEQQFGDISDKKVIDLGCGCGKLSIACLMMDASFVLGVDVDQDALSTFSDNLEILDEEDAKVDRLQADLCKPELFNLIKEKSFDTAVMNPPFGTKNNKGIDMDFLYIASKLATTAVYSLHKSSTRDYVIKKAKDFGLEANVVAELKYNLSATYKFHKQRSKDIAVDFIRFSFI